MVEAFVVPADDGVVLVAETGAERGALVPVVLRSQVLAGDRIVDPAVAMVEQAVDAERGIIAHRLVEHCLEILLAVVAQAQLRASLLLVAGLAGDDRDRTGGGVAAEQSALWNLEHLDALDVGEWRQHADAAAGGG